MLNVTLYMRPGCHLCDNVKKDLETLQAQYPHRLVEVNIESDDALHAKFLEIIPVVEVGPYSLKAPITRQSLRMTLGAAADRKDQLERVGDERYQARVQKGQTITGGDRFSFWLAKRYLVVLMIFLILYGGLPFLAPVLMKSGATAAARVIYRIYSPLCHQFGFRSFFLFGEQTFYPLEEAGLKDVKTFEEVTGIQNLDNPYSPTRFEARAFLGNEVLGYKVALCERDVAIYIAMVLFGIIFAMNRRSIKSLPWWAWFIIGIAPIAFDGFSQLFSQFNWPWLEAVLPYRESTPFLRILTGGLFGLSTAWFAFPSIEESMNETRQHYIKKFAVNEAKR